MANPTTLLLVLIFTLSITIITATKATTTTTTTTTPTESSRSATNFIKASCSTTTYRAKCVQSLLAYAPTIRRSPLRLAQTALTVSLSTAQSARTFVYKLTKFKGVKPREMAALKDCYTEIDDTVDRLSKSIKELKSVGSGRRQGSEFNWHMDNVETWVSAALTDENTCVDGFSGKALNGRMKSSIKARFVNVAQVTSNALAFINKYASKH